MATRSIFICSLRNTRNTALIPVIRPRYRCLTTSNAPAGNGPSSSHPSPHKKQQSWLTRKINSSPSAKSAFVKLANAMGYGSPKQVAGRRAFNMYRDLCVGRADEESVFWVNGELSLQWYSMFHLHGGLFYGNGERWARYMLAMSMSSQMMYYIVLRRYTIPVVHMSMTLRIKEEIDVAFIFVFNLVICSLHFVTC